MTPIAIASWAAIMVCWTFALLNPWKLLNQGFDFQSKNFYDSICFYLKFQSLVIACRSSICNCFAMSILTHLQLWQICCVHEFTYSLSRKPSLLPKSCLSRCTTNNAVFSCILWELFYCVMGNPFMIHSYQDINIAICCLKC